MSEKKTVWWKELLLFLSAVILVASAWFFLIHSRPPGKRPDLVVLPADLPPAPRGYPTRNAIYLMYLLDRLDLIETGSGIPVPPEVIESKDRVYGKTEKRDLRLDLYSPANRTEPVPGLIFIPGSIWKMDKRSGYKHYTVHFAKKGYVAATIDYRSSKQGKFPAAVEDAKCAVRWMRANAEKIGVDPNRIAVIGGSIGAHLAMMVAYSSDVKDLEGTGGYTGVSSEVAAVVDLYGPTDLTTPLGQDNISIQEYLGKKYVEDVRLYRKASPTYHLDAGDPPTLIVHGTTDQTIPVLQADRLAEKLKEHGIPYWYDRINGYPHLLDFERSVNQRVVAVMERFFEEFLKPAAQEPEVREIATGQLDG